MKILFALLCLLAGWSSALKAADAPRAPVRFQIFDLIVDSGAEALAAYQVELTAGPGVKLVGIEGGTHPTFKNPPHYDPKVLQQDRAILGAFSLAPAAGLPRGRTRVATVHVQVSGAGRPEWIVRSKTAAGPEGKKITVAVSLEERKPDVPRGQ